MFRSRPRPLEKTVCSAVPLDTDVMHEFSLHVDPVTEIPQSMTHINSMMAFMP